MSTTTKPVSWAHAYAQAYRFFDRHPEGSRIGFLVQLGADEDTGETFGTRHIVFSYNSDLEIVRIDHDATDEANR